MKRKIKNKFICITFCFVLLFNVTVYANEYGYEFEDGSKNAWGDVNLIVIEGNYALAVFDFDTERTEKEELYATIDVDISSIVASDLYIEGGMILDIGIEKLYLVELSEETAEEIMYLSETEITSEDVFYYQEEQLTSSQLALDGILEVYNGYFNCNMSAGEIVTNEEGEIVAIAVEDYLAIESAYIVEALKDFGLFSDASEETTEIASEETTESLDFSELEAAISLAKEVDTSLYTDTSEFDSAYTLAKSVYLNAKEQSEIDDAVQELLAAIDALEESYFELSLSTIIFIVVLFLVIFFFIFYFLVIKKPKKDKKQKQKTKKEDYSDRDYGEDFSPSQKQYDEQPTTVLNSSNAYIQRRRTGEKIVPKGNMFSIGRGNSDYRLEGNPAIGRVHCYLYFEKGDYYLQDNHSANGTYVNGNRIDGKYRLENEDAIKMADEDFVFFI